MEPWLAILKEFGPWVVLVGFLVWKGVVREDRKDKIIAEQTRQLMQVFERVAKIAEQNTEAYKSLVRVLRDRPCITVEDPEELPTPWQTQHKPDRRVRPSLPETDRLPMTGTG